MYQLVCKCTRCTGRLV